MSEYEEAFEERAAIMEHDGKMPRAEAEQRARDDLNRGSLFGCMACYPRLCRCKERGGRVAA